MAGILRFVQAAIVGIAVCCPTTFSGAIMATPTPMDEPVPEKWRASLARFLEEFGVEEVNSVLAASKARSFPGENPDRIIFRIEDKSSCTNDLDLCPTVIGRMKQDVFEVDAIFFGGRNVNGGDVIPRMLGVKSFPVFFSGKSSGIAVVETSKGFMVVPTVP